MSDSGLPTFLFDPETNRAIQEALPSIVIDALAVLTRLGDGATLVALAIVFYWFGAGLTWRQRGMLMAIAVATLALNAGIKGILEVPRPLVVADPPLPFAPEVYEGFSTPSAHAMGAAAVFGGLAALMETGRRWQRYLVAGLLIAVVAFSRVALGLHYVGDVLLGIVMGLGLVWFGLWLMTEDPRSVMPMFLFGLIVALLANLAGSEEFVTMSIGAATGGLVGWSLVYGRHPRPYGASILVLGLILIPAFLLFRVFEALVTLDIFLEFAGMEVPVMPGLRAAGYGIMLGLALVIPSLAEQLNDWDIVIHLQQALPFEGRVVEPDAVDVSPTEEL